MSEILWCVKFFHKTEKFKHGFLKILAEDGSSTGSLYAIVAIGVGFALIGVYALRRKQANSFAYEYLVVGI